MSNINTNEQSESKVNLNPFTIISLPKTEKDLEIPERELKDKRLLALSDLRHNGVTIAKGTIFKLSDQVLFDHFVKFGAIKEVR